MALKRPSRLGLDGLFFFLPKILFLCTYCSFYVSHYSYLDLYLQFVVNTSLSIAASLEDYIQLSVMTPGVWKLSLIELKKPSQP